jgi:hypothetical protein
MTFYTRKFSIAKDMPVEMIMDLMNYLGNKFPGSSVKVIGGVVTVCSRTPFSQE